ncbi:hypothetical protein MASR1M45_23770 [Candidatus Kapaibacterium sp.]
MNYTQLIHELLDGTLEPHSEEQLFMALAGNEDLRNELRQFIQFDLAVKQDGEAFRPEPDSQDKIFGALGITGAAAVAGAAAYYTPAAWFGRYLNQILIGLGSAIVGSMLMFLWMSNNDLNNSEISNPDNPVSLTDRFYDLSSNIPVMTSIRIDTIVKEKTIIEYISKTDTVYKEITAAEDIATNQSYNSFIQPAEFEDGNIKFFEGSSASNSFNSLNNNGMAYDSFSFTDLNLFELNDRISVEFRANQDWSVAKPIVERSSYPLFNNTSAAVMYKLSDKITIGADIRQEYFYQEYNGFAEDKSAYNYYQHTNYISAGIIARYNILNTNDINFFIQPGVSFNKVGSAARTMLGAEYNIADKVSVILGLEGSILRFSHQGNNFYSPKVGFHYGIRINP